MNPIEKRIFVVRHGQRCDIVHPNLRSDYPNSLDPSLTELGIYQSKRTKLLISHFTSLEDSWKVVSSPFLGCIETALEMTAEVTIDWRFADFLNILNYPEDITSTISFKTQWFVDKYSQIHAVGDPPLHEESYENMKKRVSDAFEEYLANMQTNVLVIVTHLIPLEIMTQIMTNENTRLRDDGFCCVTMASFAENKFKVFFQADHTHAPQYIRN